jgi:hypothetical protein
MASPRDSKTVEESLIGDFFIQILLSLVSFFSFL